MRLIEEQKVLKYQLISLVFLFISTVMIQIADHNISKHNVTIITKTLACMNTFQLMNQHCLEKEFYTLYRSLKVTSVSVDKDIFTDPNVADELKKLHRQLEEGSITIDDFLKQHVSISRKKVETLVNEYNNLSKELNDKVAKGTWWEGFKKYFLIPLQFALLAIIAYLYVNLLIQISNRTSKNSPKADRTK